MRPYGVVYTPESSDQLASLLLHIAQRASVAVAVRYTDAVVATCERLALFPMRGVPREDIRPGLRVTHHRGRTIIAYGVDDSAREVAVLGVFHGGQDYGNVLGAET